MALKPPPAPDDSSRTKGQPNAAISGEVPRFNVHMSLQHKGGSTKSFTANVIAQFYQSKGRPVIVLDADPSNKTLMAYAGLGAKPVEIMADNNTIAPRLFDDLLEQFLATESDFVVDNGAANFPPFMNYMVENAVPAVLAEAGRRLVLHVPIVGGEAMEETMQGFANIAVLWLNEAVKGRWPMSPTRRRTGSPRKSRPAGVRLPVKVTPRSHGLAPGKRGRRLVGREAKGSHFGRRR
jgi:hypothetical protein